MHRERGAQVKEAWGDEVWESVGRLLRRQHPLSAAGVAVKRRPVRGGVETQISLKSTGCSLDAPLSSMTSFHRSPPRDGQGIRSYGGREEARRKEGMFPPFEELLVS